jgi:hypothetical protein
MRTDMDVLVMEGYILHKEKHPAFKENENVTGSKKPAAGKHEKFLTNFFDNRIAPVARALKKQDFQLLDDGREVNNSESYFVRRPQTIMDAADFELLGNILKLAPRFENSEELDDVSPFIYVMF